jgi:hypothetical protein
MNLENRRENTKRKRKLELSLRLGWKTICQPTYSLRSAHNFSLLSPAVANKTWHVSLTHWVGASVLTPRARSWACGRCRVGHRCQHLHLRQDSIEKHRDSLDSLPTIPPAGRKNWTTRARSVNDLTREICALQNPTSLGRLSPRLWLVPWPGQPPPWCSAWWAGSALDGIRGQLKYKCGSLCPIDQQTSTMVLRCGLWALAPWEFRRVEFVVELSSAVHVARWVFPPMKSSRLPHPLALNFSRNPAPGRAWAYRRRAAPPRAVRLRPGGSMMALRHSFRRCTVAIRSQFTFLAWLDQNRWYFRGWLGWHRSISCLAT